MTIYINEKPHETNDSPTIISVLDSLNLKSNNGIAVAINNAIISKQQWETFQLKPNDKVTVIKATQGG